MFKKNSSKFLGVSIDYHLTWKDHIFQISGKMSKSIELLCRFHYALHQQCLLSLYYSFDLHTSILVYSCLGFQLPISLEKHLSGLQRRAISIVPKELYGMKT